MAGHDPRIHFKEITASPTEACATVNAVVIPSRWEAYGLVAIEAPCSGRPVLCTDVDGLRDHAETGAQVPLMTRLTPFAPQFSAPRVA